MMAKVIEIQNYIDGNFLKSNQTFYSYNPSTNNINAVIPDSNEKDINDAVFAAKQAFKLWSKTNQTQRALLLNKIAALIELNSEELAKYESIDQGKPLWLAKTLDIPRAALNFRHFANSLQSDKDISIIDAESGLVNYTIHEPIGVSGIITPWNLPIYLLSFKLAPALAYGNTVVAKPSEMTSVTAFKLCHILQEAGIPNGVVNMVFGYGKTAGEALVSHPDVPLISFTGSTVIGRHIAIKTAPLFKKLSLEMGGKNAAIVFDDIDLDKIMSQIIRSSFLNSGEICLASSRVYVERSAYNKFVQKFTEEVLKLKVGDPLENDTLIGPMISKEHQNKVNKYVEIARKEGAIVTTYELKLPQNNQNGYYITPTVITNINEDSVCMKEEIFGPVVCIVPFDTQEEVIQKANDTDYGLSATVWSSSVDRIHSVAHSLKVGTVWCNCWLIRNLNMPFGGMKMSGIGREGSQDSREFYTQKKTVCLKINK